MAETKQNARTKNFYYWMGKVSDVLIYPIIILALITSFSMFTAKMENKIYMVGGYSIVKILSGSMIKDGFLVDQSVVIKKIDTDDLRVGDIVSFYYYQDSGYDDPLYKELIQSSEVDLLNDLPFEDIDEIDYSVRKSRSDAEEVKTKVYFHKIEEIYMSTDGVRFFKTKGSSNALSDSFMTREDFVVGKYVDTPMWLREIFMFFSSTIGMIILVIVPLTILICMQMLSLLEQVSALMLEKKVLSRQLDYDCEECLSSNVALEMRQFDKVFLYDVIEPEKRPKLLRYLWLNKNINAKTYRVAVGASKLFDINKFAYYNYWIQNSTTASSQQIVKMQALSEEWQYYKSINEVPTKFFNKKGRKNV